ncbi:OmpH family outer membrane protein [Aeoliella mucimassa]|uniref:Outer membrane protein (OmpH-like) n=1 Tax=Aeoliella mucimassa TaxID=2527972 RepID=A0A518AQV9_9BACT|nr:OmpH family outer membrane protein [Aeoliella mucimassa]QDU57112.1 Outer membrane protein (OmpH-like) [Aeoliella mucimassa]
MNKLFALSFTLMALPCFVGCTQTEPAPTAAKQSQGLGVAIIDLDEIAHQLGSDKQIVTAIKQREAALNTKLTELAKSYAEALNKQKEAMDAEPAAEEGTVQLASYQEQANKNFQNARSQAKQNLAVHRQQLISKFREAVKPAARKVARERGLSVIVTKQDSLLYDYAPECDITNDVVEALRASATKSKPAESTAQATAPKQG